MTRGCYRSHDRTKPLVYLERVKSNPDCDKCVKARNHHEKILTRRAKNKLSAQRSRDKAGEKFSDLCSDKIALQNEFLQMEKELVEINTKGDLHSDALKAIKAKFTNYKISTNRIITFTYNSTSTYYSEYA